MTIREQMEAFVPHCEQERTDRSLALRMIAEYPHSILTRDNELVHFTSSGFVVNESLDKVLMVHHLIYRTWAWTGGHADGEADMLAVAIREAQEETGITELRPLTGVMDSFDVLPVYGHEKKGQYVGTHLHLSAAYVLVASDKETIRIKADENDGVRWIARDEMANYSNEPYLIRIYEKLWQRADEYAKRNDG